METLDPTRVFNRMDLGLVLSQTVCVIRPHRGSYIIGQKHTQIQYRDNVVEFR